MNMLYLSQIQRFSLSAIDSFLSLPPNKTQRINNTFTSHQLILSLTQLPRLLFHFSPTSHFLSRLSEIYCCSENLARFFSLIFQVWIFLEKAFLFRLFFLSYFHFLFWVGCLLMFFLFKRSLSIFVRFTF